MKTKVLWGLGFALLAVAAVMLGLSGCAKVSTTPAEQAVYTKVIKPCIPVDPWTLTYDSTARDTFAKCVDIPPQNRQAFGLAALDDALTGNLLFGGMGRYFQVTVPDLVNQYHAAAAAQG